MLYLSILGVGNDSCFVHVTFLEGKKELPIHEKKSLLLELRRFILFVQPGTFDLVGAIIYEIDQNTYQSTFYNGTIEVVEAGNVLSIESVFLVTLGIALLVLLGVWIRGQIKNLSKVFTFNSSIISCINYISEDKYQRSLIFCHCEYPI